MWKDWKIELLIFVLFCFKKETIKMQLCTFCTEMVDRKKRKEHMWKTYTKHPSRMISQQVKYAHGLLKSFTYYSGCVLLLFAASAQLFVNEREMCAHKETILLKRLKLRIKTIQSLCLRSTLYYLAILWKRLSALRKTKRFNDSLYSIFPRQTQSFNFLHFSHCLF